MRKRTVVEDCVCHNLRRTARLVTQFYDEALRGSGLRIPQFTMLAAVGEMRSATFVPLAKFLGMDRTTLARNVELLERDGFVTVTPGEEDRRQQVVRLTIKGEEALAAAMPLWARAQSKAIERLKEDGLAGLLGELIRLGSVTELQ